MIRPASVHARPLISTVAGAMPHGGSLVLVEPKPLPALSDGKTTGLTECCQHYAVVNQQISQYLFVDPQCVFPTIGLFMQLVKGVLAGEQLNLCSHVITLTPSG